MRRKNKWTDESTTTRSPSQRESGGQSSQAASTREVRYLIKKAPPSPPQKVQYVIKKAPPSPPQKVQYVIKKAPPSPPQEVQYVFIKKAKPPRPAPAGGQGRRG